MTTPSDHRIAAHRGRTMADTAIQSRLKAMDRLGLSYQYDGEFTAIVEGVFSYNLAAATWRELDTENIGYTLLGLQSALAFRKAIGKESLANGSGSIEAPPLSPAAAPHAKRPASGIETADVTSGGGEQPRPSLRLLPAVTP